MKSREIVIVGLLILFLSGCSIDTPPIKKYKNGDIVIITDKKFMVIDNNYAYDYYSCRSYETGKRGIYQEFEISAATK